LQCLNKQAPNRNGRQRAGPALPWVQDPAVPRTSQNNCWNPWFPKNGTQQQQKYFLTSDIDVPVAWNQGASDGTMLQAVSLHLRRSTSKRMYAGYLLNRTAAQTGSSTWRKEAYPNSFVRLWSTFFRFAQGTGRKTDYKPDVFGTSAPGNSGGFQQTTYIKLLYKRCLAPSTDWPGWDPTVLVFCLKSSPKNLNGLGQALYNSLSSTDRALTGN
jgi:hypothetical protein